MTDFNERIRATPAQVVCLMELGIAIRPDLTRYEAHALIEENRDARDRLSPTERQENYLRQRHLWKPTMTRGEADKVIAKDKTSGLSRELAPWQEFGNLKGASRQGDSRAEVR